MKSIAGATNDDESGILPQEFPELILGLVGPIGVDMDTVQSSLSDALKAVGYESEVVHLTNLLKDIDISDENLNKIDESKDHYKFLIKKANLFRKEVDDNAALCRLAIDKIRSIRSDKTGDPEKIRPKQAYIVRQLKSQDEIFLLRKIYGKKFIQISVHLDEKKRRELLSLKIAKRKPGFTSEECHEQADDLIKIDANESEDDYGQRVDKIFYLGDVFIDGDGRQRIFESSKRFIDALFGSNSISPTRDEYGSYIAASAALRSLDLSRQVGAAIFSENSEIISLGSNEVPKFSGGTYWGEDGEKHRDFDDGSDTNTTEKNRILHDIIKKIEESDFLKENIGIDEITKDEKFKNLFKKSLISDITEFGRMVHAEMSAICDAARLGLSLSRATIYVTTFPCHNCAKHIVASGILRVVFIEPYPKSKAIKSHSDAIAFDEKRDNKVIFEHFVGISPRRFRDIFEKGSRKDRLGEIKNWYHSVPKPQIEDYESFYLGAEAKESQKILEKVAELEKRKEKGPTSTA